MPPAKFELEIVDDEGQSSSRPLEEDHVTIGRRKGSGIYLSEVNVSRRHAVLARRSEDAAYVVRDLASYNGVWVNGARVEGERALAHGDRLRIGDFTLT